MKINDPRFTLFAGLALALNLWDSSPSHGAGAINSKSIRIARAQTNLPPAPASAIDPSVPNPPPQPDDSVPGATSQPTLPPLAPTTVPPRPSQAPAYRPPMGMHYGEEDKLNEIINPKPKPPSKSPYPGPPVTTQPLPVTSDPNAVSAPTDPVIPDGRVDRFGFAPPPGTLGQTYKRRSRLIEDTKHPRVGAVEVNLPEDVDVTSLGLKTKWTGKVWRLESDPLLPGVPHIYEIKASWGEGTEPHYRTVRLIMGRIVDLEF